MKKDNTFKPKHPVRLRTKKLSNGNKSLYLDIYDNGRRKKEYLKLYLLPEKTEAAKEGNRRVLEVAENIRAEREYYLQTNRSTFFNPRPKELDIPFADYIALQIKNVEKLRTKDYIRRYRTGESWVRRYDDKTTLGSIDKQWVQGFIHFMTVTPGKYGRILSQNTVHEYLIYIANILNNAVKEGIIPSNPTKKLATVDRPKKYESVRDYLTEEEVNRMIAIPSPEKYNNIRGAFLFACFCGLRYSDIEQLRWKNIRQDSDGWVIDKKLQKTQKMLHLPLSKRAVSFLPPRTKGNDLVFTFPKSMVTVEAYIKVWSEFAGINKHVTFHTSRHTFSVNILAKGGDIYTLGKLLGHKRITTTQIYAEVLDENKKKTMELLDSNG